MQTSNVIWTIGISDNVKKKEKKLKYVLYFKLVQYLFNVALDSLCDNSINKSSFLFTILFFLSVFSRDDVEITEIIKLRKA